MAEADAGTVFDRFCMRSTFIYPAASPTMRPRASRTGGNTADLIFILFKIEDPACRNVRVHAGKPPFAVRCRADPSCSIPPSYIT